LFAPSLAAASLAGVCTQAPATPAAPKKTAAEKVHDLPMMHAEGCCFKFMDLVRPQFKGQLFGCIGEHKVEEKTGLMWFKAADKGCACTHATRRCVCRLDLS